MSGRRRLAILVTSVALVGCALATTLMSAPATATRSPQPARLSNPGRPVSLPGASERVLEFHGLSGTVTLLGTRSGRLFYRIDDTLHGACYATGSIDGLGMVTCPPAFPSADQPVLDMSMFDIPTGADGQGHRVYPYRFEGFAADDAAVVELVGADGSSVARAPVVDNVYSLIEPPHREVAGIAAFDRGGRKIFSNSYPVPD